MQAIYIYPGSFCPPTFGHLAIVNKVAEMFGELIIICSENPNKQERWFSSEESKALWQSYDLPQNVSVEIFGQGQYNPLEIVMIRGIRGEQDLEDEKEVMLLNSRTFNIGKYFYIFSDEKFSDVSSSKARILATTLELECLAKNVSPLVISALLEKVLRIKNIFMVVGKPGAGKSTFLKMLNQRDKSNVYINTDAFNQQLKPLLRSSFGDQDLIQLALERGDELKRVIQKPWMTLLKKALANIEEESNVFVEIPYGLQTDKRMFRFIGGKIIYIGCNSDEQYEQRISQRGTSELLPLIDSIPNLEESKKIAREYKLSLKVINSGSSLIDLEKEAVRFNNLLN